MSLATWFIRAFLDVEGEARAIEQSVVHQVEKEIAMSFDIQVISGAIARLEAKLSSSSDQSATITGLQGQVSDLTTQLAAANADKAALLQDLTDIQTALIALSPDPAAQPAQ